MADLDGVHSIHIVGAGGAGMSGLAKLLAQLGYRVTGSDMKGGSALHALEDLGLEVWAGSQPERIAEIDLVVASSAVPDRDIELGHARSLGIPIWRRPELLAAITSGTPAIGATGTHGKTTSTAMLIAALRASGHDPSFVVGGQLTDLGTNAHLGDRDLFVLEADEAFGTFLSLRMSGLMVTNVEEDHMEFYQTRYRLDDAFAEVMRAVSGPVLACADDPGARRLAERTGVRSYGLADDADWRIKDLKEVGAASMQFTLESEMASLPVTVGQPGTHIATNAAGALALLAELGHDPAEAALGLTEFRGVRRRYEPRGTIAGVSMIDDYAHHPTEVAATIRAARRSTQGRLWAVFQPHLYSRTEALYAEFGQAFSGADQVVITDVFGAREAPRPGVTGELVADAAAARTDAKVSYVPHRADLAEFLAARVEAGDLVLTMGAGDITLIPAELSRLLAERP